MIECSGKCGRPGAGPYHSGDPETDKRFTWCDECWCSLANGVVPVGLRAYVPVASLPEPSGPQLNAASRTEYKIMADMQAKSVAAVAAPPFTDTGSFSGYLAAFGRDLGGDTLAPGSMDDSAAALNAGRIQWHLTDAHSDRASDVVASITAAAIDHHGLRIHGQWAPTERAQALRQMVKNGHQLGLSIDYYAASSRPDGNGGRILEKVVIVGGAVTPKPMNPRAVITEGKSGPWAPVVAWCSDAHLESGRRDPEREAEDRILAAASWPPPGMFDREISLALIRDFAVAKSRRELADDSHAREMRARRDRDNQYSADITEWLAAHRAG